MFRRYLFILLLFTIIASPLYSETKIRVAVMDLKASGVSQRTSKAVSNIIRTEMINLKRFVVIERAQMDQILSEQGLQMTGCTDQECAIEFGKLLSAKKMLLGEVSSTGTDVIITVRLVDVEKGVAEFAASEKAESKDTIDIASKKLAIQLSDKIQESSEIGSRTAGGYYLRGIIPGWGQIYAQQNLKGYAFLGAFLAAGALTVWSGIQYKSAKEDYNGLGSNLPQSEYDDEYDKYKFSTNMFLYSGIVTGVIYLANWLDILFITEPAFSRNNISSNVNFRINLTDGNNLYASRSSKPGMNVSFTLNY